MVPEPNLSVLFGPWRTERWKFKFWAGKVMKDWTLEVQNFWAVVFKYKINWCVFREFKEIVKLKVFRIMARLNNWNKNWCKCGDFIFKCDTTRGKGEEKAILFFFTMVSPRWVIQNPLHVFFENDLCLCFGFFVKKAMLCFTLGGVWTSRCSKKEQNILSSKLN